jgi:hypothetical protein
MLIPYLDLDLAHVVTIALEWAREGALALLMAVLVDWWRHRRRRV